MAVKRINNYSIGITVILILCSLLGIMHYSTWKCFYFPVLKIRRQQSNQSIQNSKVVGFVSFDKCVADGRRLGNQIFELAAVIYIAELVERKPVLDASYNISLEQLFNLNMERVKNLCPCHVIGESQHLAYDRNTEKMAFNDSNLINKTLLVAGFRQSWKYTVAAERQLRKHLVFKDEIQNFAETFLRRTIPPGWKKVGFVRVGIHSRRGDILLPFFVNHGFTVPNETYFRKAMKHFTDKYNRVQFIVCSDDSSWTREHIVNFNNISSSALNITHSIGNTAEQDFAILSMCDHVIMSTGTFGWWAGWLAKGTTIYYGNWPRKGSALEGQFNRDDFFPPTWIPMSDSD